jgi:hypothetical protein
MAAICLLGLVSEAMLNKSLAGTLSMITLFDVVLIVTQL